MPFQVRGCRPVLVNFISWKDREEVLRKSSDRLRGQNIYITEDMSRKMREHRAELQKYARQVSEYKYVCEINSNKSSKTSLQIRSRSPQKKVALRSDKLYIDNQMFVFDEDKHEVVRFNRPPSPPRASSRNYSSVDNLLRRSTSG